MTYAELDTVTNQTARALQDAGVRRNDRVGLYVHNVAGIDYRCFRYHESGWRLCRSIPMHRPNDWHFTRNCDVSVLLTLAEMPPTLAEFLKKARH